MSDRQLRGARRGLSAPWQTVGFLFLAAGLNYADRAAFSSVLAPLREDLGISDVTLGLLGSLFLWSYALASPVAGMLADRYSRRQLVICSLVLWSIVTLFTGFAHGLIMLVVLRVGLGLAESLYLPAATALLADHHGPATRGKAMSLHSIGLNVGVVAGGAFAGYMAEWYGWRAGFLVLGIVGLLWAALSRFFLPASPPETVVLARPGLRAALRYLVRIPTFHAILVQEMLAGFAIWIFLSWLPLYFREVFGMGLGSAGFAGTFMLQVSTVLGMAVGGWLSDRIAARDARHRMLALTLCYVIAGPILLIFLLEPGLAVVVATVSAFSFLRGLGESNEKPALCEIVPPCFRSTALGIMNTFATTAGGVGVFIAGWLKSSWGLHAVFAASSVMFFLAGVGMWIAYAFSMKRDMARARAYISGS